MPSSHLGGISAEPVSAERPERLAAKAWSELHPCEAEPKSVEVVKGQRSGKRTVCRLEGVGPSGSAVIAKKCRKADTFVERVIYEEVLPRLPMTALHYYGCVLGEGESGWLFLEDAGSDRYSPLLPEHRRLAARWLGTMHLEAQPLVGIAPLPDRGPPHYLELLRAARGMMEQSLTSSRWDGSGRAVLRLVICQCDVLERGWNRVATLCAPMPRTLVHGDFQPKNVRVRAGPGGLGLYPFDWEKAGWGVPAIDLAPARPLPSGYAVDLDAYERVVRNVWPGMDTEAIRLMENVGRLLRDLAAIRWACASLDGAPEKALSWMRIYGAALSETMNGVLSSAEDRHD